MDEYDKRIRLKNGGGERSERGGEREASVRVWERQSENKRDKKRERASNINGKFNRRLVRAVSSDARRVSRAPEVN